MAASMAARGAFILFEGVDRCGKTTQSTRLVETLKAAGIDAELWRYPDRTTAMGQMVGPIYGRKHRWMTVVMVRVNTVMAT
jgi:dTMP kinase